MLELLQMWALVEILGLAALPLTVTVCHNLPDRGWAFSKALGLAVFIFCIWFPLMCLRFLPFSQLFILGIGLLFLAGNLLGLRSTYQTILKTIKSNRSYIVIAELVFLAMVFLLGWLRSYHPDIRSFEMFMDEGFIAGIMRSPHLPPNDMWFAGYSINYYYYAHFVVATLAKLLGQSPSIAFNTGISMYFGLTAINLFGVTCNIIAWARHLRSHGQNESEVPLPPASQVHPPLLRAAPYGLLTMVIGLILGNLAATQQWWQLHGEGLSDRFNWFNPSRVINSTINEFPAFSFLLSCFHAHVLALTFTILAIGLAFNLFLELDGRGLSVFGHGWQLPFTLVVTALVLGGLFTMNGWDFPTYTGLAIVCIIIQQWLAYHSRFEFALLVDIFSAAISLIALAFILYLPFYLTFVSPSQGLGLVAVKDRSSLSDEFLIYGLFIFIFLSLLIVSAWRHPLFTLKHESAQRSPLRLALIILGILLLIDILILRFVTNSPTFVTMGSITIVAVVLLFYHIHDRAHAFTLLLGAAAFLLIAGCEIFFLRDVFAGNYPRMNTVFKFYFQAWALLSIASGCGVFFLLEFLFGHVAALKTQPSLALWFQSAVNGLWTLALLSLLLASTAYPLLAPQVRLAHFDPQTQKVVLSRTNSLDGLTYLQSCRPPDLSPDSSFCNFDVTGDYAAIRWLNANVQGDPVLIEARGFDDERGDDYTLFGRISAFTGLPTLMIWQGHEYQWRVNWLNQDGNTVEFTRRAADLDTIYTQTNPQIVLSTLARYNAQYLYVGALEHIRYPQANLKRFASFMNIVYQANGVTIYKVK